MLCTVTLWYEILRWYCSIRVGFRSYSFYVQGTYMKTTEHNTSSLVRLTIFDWFRFRQWEQCVLTCLWPRVMAEYNCPQRYLVNDFHNNFSKRKPRRISTPFNTRTSFSFSRSALLCLFWRLSSMVSRFIISDESSKSDRVDGLDYFPSDCAKTKECRVEPDTKKFCLTLCCSK